MKSRTTAAYYELFAPRPERSSRLREPPPVGEQLSAGSTSTVHQSGEYVLKRVTGREMRTTLTELSFLTALKHPSIMRVHRIAFTPQSISFSMPTYRMNLEDYLVGQSDRAALQSIVLECAMGLDYLHSKDIIHADLKPANIFVVIRESRAFGAVIGDCGLSRLAVPQPTLHHIQTPIYRAPEAIIGSVPTVAIDNWSLGVIVAEMLGLKVRINTEDASRYACEYYLLPHTDIREQNIARLERLSSGEQSARVCRALGAVADTPLGKIASGCLRYTVVSRLRAAQAAQILAPAYQPRERSPIAGARSHILALKTTLPVDTLCKAATGIEKAITGQVPRITDDEFEAAKKLSSERHGQVLL